LFAGGEHGGGWDVGVGKCWLYGWEVIGGSGGRNTSGVSSGILEMLYTSNPVMTVVHTEQS
jgi:hypothetical protein